MNTISVSNGDIQLNNGKIKFVTSTDKLIQDLNRWLNEPLGTGYTTPGFGSTLYEYIGTAQDGLSSSQVSNEVLRVLQLYQGQQSMMLKNAQNAAQLSNWNKGEVIQSIQSINANIVDTSIIVSVSLLTLNNNLVNINIAIDNYGVTVTNG